MKIQKELIAFLCFTLLVHEGYPAAVSLSDTEEKFMDMIEYYKNVLKGYQEGRMNLKEGEEKIFENKKLELEKLFNKMKGEFSGFSEFMLGTTQLRPEQVIKDLCVYGNKHYEIISGTLKKIAGILGPEHQFLRLAFKTNMKYAAELCLDGYSPRNYFYDLFNRTMTTEWRGYTILSIFDKWWEAHHASISVCSYENKNETKLDTRDYSSHEIRVEAYDDIFGQMLHSQKVIPEFHACDEYHDSEKDIGVFKSASALNEKIHSQALLYRSGDRVLDLSKYIVTTNSL